MQLQFMRGCVSEVTFCDEFKNHVYMEICLAGQSSLLYGFPTKYKDAA